MLYNNFDLIGLFLCPVECSNPSQTCSDDSSTMDSTSQHLVELSPSVENVDLKIGFIGAGRMAQALSSGFSQSGLSNSQLLVCLTHVLGQYSSVWLAYLER